MENKKIKNRFPIGLKTVLAIFVFGLILAEIGMVYFTMVTSNTNKEYYKSSATKLSNTVALTVDIDKFITVRDEVLSIYDTYEEKPTMDKKGTPEYEDYMSKIESIKQTPEHKELQTYLLSIKNANPETDGIYLVYVDYARKLGIYLVYDTESELYPTGTIDDIYEEDYPMLEDHMLGFVASIFEEEGTGETLVTAGAPIVRNNEVVGYSLVDINMKTVRASQADKIVRFFVYLVTTVILLSALGATITHFVLVKPVNKLRKAAKSYDVNNPEKTHETFSNLEINSHDEFRELADSMKVMEADINAKIHELTEANDSLRASREFAGKMEELANKDALTGVKNKAAFDKAANELNEKIANKEVVKFGLAMIDLNYLKNINDDYGHDSGDHALVKLCNIIRGTFTRSVVYRVGGDEFVVILQGRDCLKSSALIDEFNHKIEELVSDKDLSPDDQVSAAIGYSAFDKDEDSSVDDVFKKADKAMYARKRKMKGQE